MKRIFLTLIALFLVFTLAPVVEGEDVTEQLTFEWRMEDTTNLKEWKLLWNETPGGPYEKVAVIPYDPNDPGPVYSNETSTMVTGDQATHIMKYFVMIACGDIPQSDGALEYSCSDNSNEVFHNFWIPAGMFSIPIDFQIRPNP